MSGHSQTPGKRPKIDSSVEKQADTNIAKTQSVSTAKPEVLVSESGVGKHAHKLVFGYVSLILVVAVASAIYSWQHGKVVSLTSDNNNLNHQISNLNSQVVNLNKQIAALSNQVPASRNTQRQLDVEAIVGAVYDYVAANGSKLPSVIPTSPTDICATGSSNCSGLVNLTFLTAAGKYLPSIPKDPLSGTSTDTGYKISHDTSGRVTVSAPSAELGQEISATK